MHSAPPPAQTTDLIGAWRLERFVITFADGRPPRFPFGEDARGQLIYAADGRMSAVLSRAERPLLGAHRLETATQVGPAAKAQAFDSYLSYAGRWRLEGDRVIHAVELALVPEIVGIEQVRTVRLDRDERGPRLRLSYALTARSGVERRYVLTWRRADTPDAPKET